MYEEPRPMKEIHEIQARIHEEIRRMTNREKIEAIHKEAEEAKKKYGIKLKKVSPVNV